MPETAYDKPLSSGGQLDHAYGERVHLLSDPWALSILSRLSHPDVQAPLFHDLLEAGYRRLLHAVVDELNTTRVCTPTRMSAAHPDAAYHGVVVDSEQRVTVVDVARGGMLPSYVFQRELLLFMDPAAVRVDHVYMQRIADETGHVVGVETAGSKIGGTVNDSVVLIPDPMGATGSSMVDVVRLYSELPGGAPKRLVTCHLIITPEFLQRLLDANPNVEVYALRLDRGLSPESVLSEKPGTRWSMEKGLDDTDYIVPGAGGLGELVNNAFV